jgi:dTDP-4-dehydrorhamnose reductase
MTGELVTGANGQLGRALRPLLPRATFVGRDEFDIADRDALSGFDWGGTTAVINAAGWTAVDAAEDSAKTLSAWDVNATGVANLAWHARRLQIPLVHVSTDYVFKGDEQVPVAVDTPLDPQSVYGITKAASEMAARLAPQHYVVRTSWVFGDGPNFVRTMLRLSRTRSEVSVVDDQVGRPTYAVDLAGALVALLERRRPSGTYHATGSGDVVSWAEVAAAALEGTDCAVRHVSTSEYLKTAPQAAPRPSYSALDLTTITDVGIAMRDWRVALKEYLAVERERAQ